MHGTHARHSGKVLTSRFSQVARRLGGALGGGVVDVAARAQAQSRGAAVGQACGHVAAMRCGLHHSMSSSRGGRGRLRDGHCATRGVVHVTGCGLRNAGWVGVCSTGKCRLACSSAWTFA
eukprot:1150672-Pelagomonas_calceolata.AAC.5